ncbi:hypothetical protein SS322685_1869 [Shigella sonnei 3226-85]|nr:hypothetical protein SS322685_1869 [Shigella sonnei 3226-85]
MRHASIFLTSGLTGRFQHFWCHSEWGYLTPFATLQFLPDSLTRRCDIISGGCVGDCLVPVVKKTSQSTAPLSV